MNLGWYSLEGFEHPDVPEPEIPMKEGRMVRVSDRGAARNLQRRLFNFVVLEDRPGVSYPFLSVVKEMTSQGVNVIVPSDILPKESPEDTIERERLFSVFVVGPARSGTSLATRILELLGVNMVYDSESNEAEKQLMAEDYERRYGHHPNRTGFFEIARDFMGHYLRIWGTPYSGCKMIMPVTDFRLEVIKRYPSKVVLTVRDFEETAKSQAAYGRGRGLNPEELEASILEQKVRFETFGIPVLTVVYGDLLKDPKSEIGRIRDFIGSDRDISDAVDFVDPKLSRFKNLCDG